MLFFHFLCYKDLNTQLHWSASLIHWQPASVTMISSLYMRYGSHASGWMGVWWGWSKEEMKCFDIILISDSIFFLYLSWAICLFLTLSRHNNGMSTTTFMSPSSYSHILSSHASYRERRPGSSQPSLEQCLPVCELMSRFPAQCSQLPKIQQVHVSLIMLSLSSCSDSPNILKLTVAIVIIIIINIYYISSGSLRFLF